MSFGVGCEEKGSRKICSIDTHSRRHKLRSEASVVQFPMIDL